MLSFPAPYPDYESWDLYRLASEKTSTGGFQSASNAINVLKQSAGCVLSSIWLDARGVMALCANTS
jgi:hypothetical protein